jgi:hypothetical protein
MDGGARFMGTALTTPGSTGLLNLDVPAELIAMDLLRDISFAHIGVGHYYAV